MPIPGSCWRFFSSRARTDHGWFVLVLCAAILPNLVWIGRDKTAWPWDQAWYAKYSVELFFTLIYSPAEWLPAMLNAFGRQAPGIAWVGQFFVPVGLLTGSIDFGLMTSIVCAQAAALFLMTRALWELSGRRFWIAVTGLVVMASAPLFIALGHYYLVEMMQTTAVCWFVFIMARAPKWSRLLIGGQLGLATAWAMLAKVSSPLFCVGPGIVALYYLFRRSQTADSDTRIRAVTTVAVAIPLGLATVGWYHRNIHSVVAHVSMASSGPVAELYGKSEQLLPSLKYWLAAVDVNFFTGLTIFATLGSVCAAMVPPFTRSDEGEKAFHVAAIVAALQIATGLSVFSMSSNRDDRYLLPMLPYFVLIVCWSVARLNRSFVTVVLIATFALQWGDAHARALGFMPQATGARWLSPIMIDARDQRTLDALVRRTCADTTSGFYWNAVGVQLIWLNAPGLSYAAAKRFAPSRRLTCDYDAIAYYDTDEETAWRRLMSKNINYYIGLDASTYSTPSTAVDRTVNTLNEPILQRVETSGLFHPEAGVAEHHGILILKRVDSVDHVIAGRALSDRGKHQQAIEELTKATALNPENVEAWANLAYAYERHGHMAQAIVAGIEARRLNPTHYYVNLGLARAFFEQKKWRDAVERAEDAVAHAPGVPERVTALAMAARGSFHEGQSKRGCILLRQANNLQSSREVLSEIANHGCAK